MKNCKYCGKEIEEDSLFCRHCGKQVCISSEVTEENLANVVTDEYGVLYSKDGTRLLKCENKDIKEYMVKDGTKVICDSAFQNCKMLTRVIIPSSVTTIEGMAFHGCSGLIHVNIGEGVTTIGGCAFQNCTGLTELTIPNKVTTIDDWAFRGCSRLTYVNIGEGVTTMDEEAFSGCIGLTKFEVKEGNECFFSKDGVLFTKDMRKLIQFPTASPMTSYTIPDSVTEIGDSAFYGCTGLTEVTIPNSVTTIGSYAFEGSTGLTEVTIPKSVTEIGEDTFRDCTGLTHVNIGEGVTTIGNGEFYGCTGLTDITIPNSVTSIEYFAFSDCSGLTGRLIIPPSVSYIGEYAFQCCSELIVIYSLNPIPPACAPNAFHNIDFSGCVVYVPKGSYKSYTTANEWKKFHNVAEINDSNNINSEKVSEFIELMLSAKQGNADAQYEIGNFYFNGEFVPHNYEVAFEWYRIAAEEGHVGALYQLGECYDCGKGTPKSHKKAVECYKQAEWVIQRRSPFFNEDDAETVEKWEKEIDKRYKNQQPEDWQLDDEENESQEDNSMDYYDDDAEQANRDFEDMMNDFDAWGNID